MKDSLIFLHLGIIPTSFLIIKKLLFPLLPIPLSLIEMYPSSSSASSQSSMSPNGLIRYGSAPGSLLSTAVDSVIDGDREFSSLGLQSMMGQYFSGDSSSITSESSCKVSASSDPKEMDKRVVRNGNLQRSYGLNEMAVGSFTTASSLRGGGGGGRSSSSCLIRQSSSPAGLLNQLSVDNGNGFSVTRRVGDYKSQSGHAISRLKPQLSFTRQDSLSLSQVSEGNSDTTENGRNASSSYGTASFGMGSWDNTNSIVFSPPPNKRAKHPDGDIVTTLKALESQFSMPQTALEMAMAENFLQIPKDSVPCRIRAKRGCATHPRSIAERERRTRITGKLKKLEELFPNMDKQTSYADMLDLAVEHIKCLQNQVEVSE